MRRLVLFVAPLALAGCATLTGPDTTPNAGTSELKNARGQSVGMATLTEVPGGVRILVEVKGVPPGEKGVHIHMVGKCEGPAFTSAGGHFNPDGKQHGTMNPQGPHAGDLPNIVVDAAGNGRFETTTNRVSLGGGTTSLFDVDGSALVVHAAPDDFKTDPTGNSGDRIVCGVIIKRPQAAGASMPRPGY
jgi:superoxide dismutase, Cu-Zn family